MVAGHLETSAAAENNRRGRCPHLPGILFSISDFRFPPSPRRGRIPIVPVPCCHPETPKSSLGVQDLCFLRELAEAGVFTCPESYFRI
jgi:hypothetical protein